MKKILLVDDEPDIVEFLKYNLEKNDFEVIGANSGWEAVAKMRYNPDLIVLDVLMPELDGFEAFAKIMEMEERYVPVIFLTAKTSEEDEIKALEMGAVDYIRKPVSPQKLVARIKANINSTAKIVKAKPAQKVITAGTLEIDPNSMTVTLDETEIFFPRKEFQLLKLMAEHPEEVFTRKSLLKSVWGDMHYGVLRTVDVHISKIRERLGSHSNLIVTVKGIGYKFKPFN